ncbi:hypothetical protein J5S49_02665 [Virgibacillus halodenitrificans]|uniref:hypothetical protein n=1 Tax=Virgibacillus halodenitrificans TaxID=1482 RepID=UPI001F2FA098|nr:hypothetical protein [Virgibacillus halodenitrificans]MCG1027193.1 hypothetical protein [Virgibacillus halodenitrificans]
MVNFLLKISDFNFCLILLDKWNAFKGRELTDMEEGFVRLSHGNVHHIEWVKEMMK